MSDDISIPRVASRAGSAPAGSYTHSYRSRRTGMDASTRRLFMAASALGMVLLAGMGIWSFGGHRPAGVPTIEADTRPLRVKPDNPGGMTVVGANEQVTGGRGEGEAGDLAPAAERPDPQALRAQRAAPSAPPAAAPVQPAASVAVPATPAVAAAPAAAPAVTRASFPAPASASAPQATGSAMVQLAALETEAGATAEWQRLAHKAPELLGDRKPSIVRAERDGKAFWRLRTGGFADTAGATEFCRKVRAKGLGCTISS